MKKSPHSGSIFSQRLDRAVFLAYFLGAVVPLLALAYSVQNYVLPAVSSDGYKSSTVIGVTCAIGVLSLAAFFALRRITRNAVDKMKVDNGRLHAILVASQDLSTSLHAQAVAETTVICARNLTATPASYLLMRSDHSKPLEPIATSGKGASSLYEEHRETLAELVEAAISSGSAAVLESGARSQPLAAAIAMPIGLDANEESVLVVADTASGRRFEDDERDALSTLVALSSVAIHNADLQDAQRNFFAHITDLLIAALDAHVEGRHGHAHSVAQLSNRLGRELGLGDDQMQNLHFAALLHDIGMLRIDAKHQRSPGHFQKHPVVGHRMLSHIRLWEKAAPIVLYHHEWFDGAGYPEGRRGSEIPFESRIIAVADCFDALTRNDTHRMASSVDEALNEIRRGAGSQFDPDVVVALAKLAERGELQVGPR